MTAQTPNKTPYPASSIAGMQAAAIAAKKNRSPEEEAALNAGLAEEAAAKRALRARFPDDNLPED